MEIGIVGLPLSGKTTIFNALTGSSVEVDRYGGKRETHRAVVAVPDSRLETLAKIFQPEKVTPATVEFVDTAGVQRAARKRASLDDELLGYLRTVDEIMLILRAFRNPDVPHPEGSIDPVRDATQLLADFLLSDLAIVESRVARLEKTVPKTKNEAEAFELEVLRRFQATLEAEKPLRALEITPEEEKAVRGYGFLTLKPTMLVLNIDEADIGSETRWKEALAEIAHWPGTAVEAVCGQIEMEIAQLEPEDRKAFLEDLGLQEPAMSRLIRASYDLLGLVTFFTHESKEVRAWTTKIGATAPQAAGEIHTDFEKGFIRAEVTAYDDFIAFNGENGAKEAGKLRLEGKEYIVQDGDVMHFRFNV